MARTIPFSEITRIASENGLTLMGCAEVHAIRNERDRLIKWQGEGFAAGMEYMRRDAELFITPQKLLASAQSVISVALEYERRSHPKRPPGFARVARYAWGRDYHIVLKKRLQGFADDLAQYGETRVFTDAVPLLERAFGAQAGLGFIGKNSLLIRPGIGSYFFLGEVIAGFEITNPPTPKSFKGCGSCTRCASNCPTDAIVSDAVVDARRCISYLTIEKRGAFDPEESKMIGEWIFGCDICQDVCPFNHTALKVEKAPNEKLFMASEGVGPLVSILDILSLRTDKEFQVKFRGTPILRAKRPGLIRNACAVAVNTAFSEAVVKLRELLDDTDLTVRQAAEQALATF